MANTTPDTYNKANGATQDYKNKMQNTAALSLGRISHDTGEKLGAMVSKFSDSASEYVQTSRAYVKENPEKGIAIAAVVGAVIGSLFTLSLRRK